jgi:DinB superfamily
MTPPDLRYPIGKFLAPSHLEATTLAQWVRDIAELPALMAQAVAGLSEAQLDTPYRPDGWTVRQVVHHTADSHLNALCRVKLALTEANPTIKPYEEQLWATLPDYQLPVAISLELLAQLHARWAYLLQNMPPEAWQRTFYHPGNQATYPLQVATGTYSWHGRHHTAHITHLRQRMGW